MFDSIRELRGNCSFRTLCVAVTAASLLLGSWGGPAASDSNSAAARRPGGTNAGQTESGSQRTHELPEMHAVMPGAPLWMDSRTSTSEGMAWSSVAEPWIASLTAPLNNGSLRAFRVEATEAGIELPARFQLAVRLQI